MSTDHPLNDWARSPAVMLDRDGTIIVEKHYLCDPNQAILEAGAAEGLRAMAALGFKLIVVSNQSGVGRGFFSMDAAHAVNARVDELLRAEGVDITAWYICPHGPDTLCDCRKPQPGMALQAAREHELDLGRSFVVGDKRSDVELAHAIGGCGILVTTGHGEADRSWAERSNVAVCRNLVDAATIVRAASGSGTSLPQG